MASAGAGGLPKGNQRIPWGRWIWTACVCSAAGRLILFV